MSQKSSIWIGRMCELISIQISDAVNAKMRSRIGNACWFPSKAYTLIFFIWGIILEMDSTNPTISPPVPHPKSNNVSSLIFLYSSCRWEKYFEKMQRASAKLRGK